jgi:predicted nucleic acid-binding protein
MVVIDTTVWIGYLGGFANPETIWLDRELIHQRLGLTDMILCEVLQGIRDDAAFHQVRSELLEFEIFDTGGLSVALASARNYRTLRKRGHTVRKTVDCLIATFCLENDHTLLHRDRDFDAFEKHLGLRVLHP